MKLSAILDTKGRHVVTVGPERSVLDAVHLLVQHNIGSVVVTEGDRLLGILTERDVLRLTARAAGELGSYRVDQVMTREVVTGSPDDDLLEVMGLLTERRIRHLPIVDDEGLRGIVSIGDVVNACRQQAEEDAAHMRQYIQGAS